MNKTSLTDYLNSLEKCGIPGCDCVVYHHRQPVFRHIRGYADADGEKPLTEKNTYWLYSSTKLFTCTAVMQLVEKGLVGLDDPVSDSLPEYKNMKVKCGSGITAAKNTMTIRHLLSMQSGLNYELEVPSIQKVLAATKNEATTRQVIEALANEPLDFEPGTHFQYSLSHDVLAAVVEVVSGQRYGKYLDAHIFKPLGLKNTGFALTPDREAAMSGLFRYNMDTMTAKPIPCKNRYVLSKNYESGGAGLISTVNDCIMFLDALCHGGMGANGYRILTEASIFQMRKDQMNETSKKDFDLFGRAGYSYGLGVRTLIEKEKSGAKSPLGEFGWDSAAGAFALIDVENRLSVFYMQHVLDCGYAYDVIHPKLRDLSYEMVEIVS